MFVITFFAVRKGVSVKNNTIFAIGFVSEMDGNMLSPQIEILLAFIGLLVNLIIAGILYIVYQVLAHTGSIMVHVLVQWLAFIYLMLFFFDLLPGLPLDSGKFLRAIVWKATNNYIRAARIFSWSGWIIGLCLIITGVILTAISKQWFVGVLLALPGLILQNSATHQRRQLSGKSQKTEESIESDTASSVD
jgi:Zn-dependent protease